MSPEPDPTGSGAREKILVLGIGNILRADDGLGVRLIERLLRRYHLPDFVEALDGGSRGMALVPFIERADRLIVIDAINGGEKAPGELYRLDFDQFRKMIGKKVSTHELGFIDAWTVASINDRAPKMTLVLGARAVDVDSDSMSLTEPIERALDRLIEKLIEELAGFNAHLKLRPESARASHSPFD